MFKKLLLGLFLSLTTAYSQNTVGTTYIEDNVFDGYTLFTIYTETYLINNCGELINQWTSSYPPGNAVYLLENGNILRAGRTDSNDITFGGQGGVIEMFDWDGNLTWQYFYDTPMMRQHHDIFPMPNGNVLILAATRMTNAEAIEAGRNPTLLSQTDLYNEQIVEVTPNGPDDAVLVWEWNVKDHLIQNIDITKDNFGTVSLNPGKLNINFLNGSSSGSNWLHFNSIQFNASLNQIVISSRNLSEIYVIDHSTTTAEAATSNGGIYGNGGDFLYRWGNPQSYNMGTEADRKLYGQHYPYIIGPEFSDENKIILFNNGNGRDPLFSEVFILNPEAETPGFYSYSEESLYGPQEPEFIYENEESPADFFSAILSSAQLLTNDNILICEGINGRIFEINQNKNILWEYIIPVNSNTGAIASQGDSPGSFSNVTFRAIKYPLDYAAFSERSIEPQDPIESNSNLDACSSLGLTDIAQNAIDVFPNPTYNEITVNSKSKIDKLELYNLLGKKIIETDSNIVDLSQQANGIYILKIYSDAKAINKKVIKN